MVLRDLPPHTTAAGVPAKVLGVATERRPSEEVDQNLKNVLYDKDRGGNGGDLGDDKQINGSTAPRRAEGGAGAPSHWRTARVRDIEKRSVL